MAITVKEAIRILNDISNKEMMIMIDCPNCGIGHQLEYISECVVLGNQNATNKETQKL